MQALNKHTNIEGLLAEIQVDLKEEGQESKMFHKGLLNTYGTQLKKAQAEHLEKREELFNISDTLEKLKAKTQILGVGKLVKRLQNLTEDVHKQQDQDVTVQDRQNQRVMKIFQEISEGKTDLLHEPDSVSEVARASVNGSVGQALRAEIQVHHGAFKQQNQVRKQFSDRQQGELQEQQNKTQKQTEALKKANFWGQILGVLQQAVVNIVSIVSAPLSPVVQTALSSLANVGMTGLSQGIIGRFTNRFQNNQLLGQNAAQANQSLAGQQQQAGQRYQKFLNQQDQNIKDLEAQI